MTQVDLSTLAPGALSAQDKKIEPVGNSKNMLASRSEVMALVAIAFYFLILTGKQKHQDFISCGCYYISRG